MDPLNNISGHALGEPFRVVEVSERADLERAVALARSHGRPLVATGLRTSYWHNVMLDGAVVADMRAFDKILGFDADNGVVTVQPGVTIRALDEFLHERGYQLWMYPDAFGETLVGSCLANGMTAGVGMMRGTFLDQVLGFEALLPDGSSVQIGASRTTGAPADGVGYGLPDLRSLFFGAEGTLGIISEIDLALVPLAWQGVVEWRVDDDRIEDVIEFARQWRRREAMDLLRWVWDGQGVLTARVSSRIGQDELEARLVKVAALKNWPQPKVTRVNRLSHSDKWSHPPGETWREAARQPFFGLDAMVPWSRTLDAWRWARGLNLTGISRKRVVLYFGEDGVNLGVHCGTTTEQRAEARANLESRIPELLSFGAIPYRPGLVWAPHFRPRIDPSTLSLLRKMSRVLDPSGTMNPGVGLLGDSADRA